MIVFSVLLLAGIVNAAPAPKADAAVIAPVVAASPVVTATSSQVIARNYNAIAAPLVAAPAVAPAVAPVATAPFITSPYAAYPAYPAYSAYASPFYPYF